jgi:hypothetical protein
MAEWTMAAVLKTAKGLVSFEGSNPPPSAVSAEHAPRSRGYAVKQGVRFIVLAVFALGLGLALWCAFTLLAAPALPAAVPPASPVVLITHGPCATTVSSTIPTIRIEFLPQPCSFTLADVARGITLSYEIVVSDWVDQFTPITYVNCGSRGPAGLYDFPTIGGGGQRYAVADLGFCMSPTPAPITITPGRYAAQFPWDGMNWNGPSDYTAPKGPPFPPGRYTFGVIVAGSVPRSSLAILLDRLAGRPAVPVVPQQISGTLTIELMP